MPFVNVNENVVAFKTITFIAFDDEITAKKIQPEYDANSK